MTDNEQADAVIAGLANLRAFVSPVHPNAYWIWDNGRSAFFSKDGSICERGLQRFLPDIRQKQGWREVAIPRWFDGIK